MKNQIYHPYLKISKNSSTLMHFTRNKYCYEARKVLFQQKLIENIYLNFTLDL